MCMWIRVNLENTPKTSSFSDNSSFYVHNNGRCLHQSIMSHVTEGIEIGGLSWLMSVRVGVGFWASYSALTTMIITLSQICYTRSSQPTSCVSMILIKFLQRWVMIHPGGIAMPNVWCCQLSTRWLWWHLFLRCIWYWPVMWASYSSLVINKW